MAEPEHLPVPFPSHSQFPTPPPPPPPHFLSLVPRNKKEKKKIVPSLFCLSLPLLGRREIGKETENQERWSFPRAFYADWTPGLLLFPSNHILTPLHPSASLQHWLLPPMSASEAVHLLAGAQAVRAGWEEGGGRMEKVLALPRQGQRKGQPGQPAGGVECLAIQSNDPEDPLCPCLCRALPGNPSA